jgi:hypothetical protein
LRLRIGSCEFSAPFSRANDKTDGLFIADRPKRRAARCKHERSDALRPDWLAAEQQLQRYSCVASLLNEDVETLALIINCTPQEHAFACTPADHLAQVPARRWRQFTMAQTGRALWTELHGPGTHRLVAHIDAAVRHNLFGIAQAECQAEAQPHCVMDDRRREPATFAGNSSYRHLLEATITALHETRMR